MDKNKIPIIILAILFIASCFFAFNFYNKSQKFFQDAQKLTAENQTLNERLQKYRSENRSLRDERDQLASEHRKMREALDVVERERNKLKQKYEQASRDKESLIEELKNLSKTKTERRPEPSISARPAISSTAPAATDEYWQGLIKEKAELELRLEDVLAETAKYTSKINELESKNQDLQLQIEDLNKIKTELERKVDFNARTIQIITKDLVREKEDRRATLEELSRLKDENISLARELKLTRKMREDLENTLVDTQDAKQILERKIEDMGTVLKEKSVEMSDLHRQLSATISSAEKVMPSDAKAVELPPIVVKSETRPSVPTTLLEGKVLAVNEREKFVIVDIGTSSGIKPGDKFSVLSDGRKVGSLEVVETRLDIAACDIKQAEGRIREGDIVRFNR